MDSEFPGNSHRERKDPGPKAEQKRVDRVVAEGRRVVRRKKPLGKRLSEAFVGGDARSVWSYVALDVLIPAARETIADAFTQGIERMIFGESSAGGRRPSRRPGGGSYVSYNRYSGGSDRDRNRRDEPRHQMSRRGRSSHDFDEIIVESRVEAEEIIDNLFELTSKFDCATVADLYDMVGIAGNFVDAKWGWTDLRGAGVTRLPRSGGYLLDLPRPEPLD